MKKLAIIISICFLALFAGMVSYVGLSEDFIAPENLKTQEGLPENHPVWSKNMDDLVLYLSQNGIITDTETFDLLSDGIATVARKYNGIEIYWWDIQNLQENTPEYKAYVEASKDGNIDLWGSGNMMQVNLYGPFALNATQYAGNINELDATFKNFAVDESGNNA